MLEVCQIPEHKGRFFQGRCVACEKEATRREVVACFRESCSQRILDLLWDEGRGLMRHEGRATSSKIPEPILRAIPEWARNGSLRPGFGIGGGIGVGKTQAVASIVKEALAGYAEREIIPTLIDEHSLYGRLFPKVRWSSWPDEVHWLRSHAINGAEERVDDLANASVLVLDDLGRERIKGDYSQDYGASHLDYIVNRRYREERPIIWTTNVRQADLVGLYGAALVRRLVEPNPMVWVEGLKPFNTPGRSE